MKEGILLDDFLFSLNTVFPLLLMMAAGFLARRLGVIDDHGAKQANNCVFRIFLPLLLCFNIMDTEMSAAIDMKALLYAAAATLLCFGALFVIVPRFVAERPMRSVLIQGIARSNYAIFGIPLVTMMYPEADTSIAALMVIAVVPIFNILSTIALMMNAAEKPGALKLLRGVATNPIILGTLLGFVLWRLNVQLPPLLDAPLRKLASVATPLALFVLGASLDFSKAKSNARLLTIGVLGRLVIVPAIFLMIAVALGIRDVALAALIAVFASPTAVSSYPMAQLLGGDNDLAAGQVVFTTALSCVTVFLWVFFLRSMGFLG